MEYRIIAKFEHTCVDQVVFLNKSACISEKVV